MNIGPSGWGEGNENVPPKLLKKSKFGGTFRCYIFTYYIDFQCNILSIQRFFHGIYGVCLSLFGDVDVRLHGFVIGMAGEFHYNLGRDADREGHADSVQQNYHQQGSQQDKVRYFIPLAQEPVCLRREGSLQLRRAEDSPSNLGQCSSSSRRGGL